MPDKVLRPRDAWADKAAYDKSAKELAERFRAEFRKYAMTPHTSGGLPRLRRMVESCPQCIVTCIAPKRIASP